MEWIGIVHTEKGRMKLIIQEEEGKNMKYTSFLWLAVIAVFLSGGQCKKDQVHLGLVNCSDRFLYGYINNSWPGVGPTYPDTTLWGRTKHGYTLIKPHSRQTFETLLGTKGEVTFGHIGDTLSFAIFDADTIAAYPWDVINSEYKILRRYDLSIHDLQKLNYTLYYPPTEAMRNMKMYPEYGANVD